MTDRKRTKIGTSGPQASTSFLTRSQPPVQPHFPSPMTGHEGSDGTSPYGPWDVDGLLQSSPPGREFYEQTNHRGTPPLRAQLSVQTQYLDRRTIREEQEVEEDLSTDVDPNSPTYSDLFFDPSLTDVSRTTSLDSVHTNSLNTCSSTTLKRSRQDTFISPNKAPKTTHGGGIPSATLRRTNTSPVHGTAASHRPVLPRAVASTPGFDKTPHPGASSSARAHPSYDYPARPSTTPSSRFTGVAHVRHDATLSRSQYGSYPSLPVDDPSSPFRVSDHSSRVAPPATVSLSSELMGTPSSTRYSASRTRTTGNVPYSLAPPRDPHVHPATSVRQLRMRYHEAGTDDEIEVLDFLSEARTTGSGGKQPRTPHRTPAHATVSAPPLAETSHVHVSTAGGRGTRAAASLPSLAGPTAHSSAITTIYEGRSAPGAPHSSTQERSTPRAQTQTTTRTTPTARLPQRAHTMPVPLNAHSVVTSYTRPRAEDTSIIQHDPLVQRAMDARGIAWYVQLELALGVQDGKWTWSDILTGGKLDRLVGNNAHAAPRVASVMQPGAPERKRELWIEADREHEAMLEGEGRGLGCMGKWKDKENWYGGCIQQRASVIVDNTSPHGFRIILQRPETHGSSRMILRFMGSRRFLQVSTKALDTASGPGVRVDREALKKFLCKRHILLGRTFVFLYNKEGSIFLYETDEDYEREPSISQGDGKRLSLDALLQWYMPPSHNGRQPIRKAISRLALAFSITIPVFMFEPENIVFIGDITAPGAANPPTTEQIMSDGCSYMNHAGFSRIHKLLAYEARPCAIQSRVAGSKGVWTLHPDEQEMVDNNDDAPRIWISDSQQKIKYPALHTRTPAGRALCIFNLVAPARVTTPARLAMLSIMNVSHNGIPTSVLKRLLEKSLKERIEPLTQWEGPYAEELLAKLIEEIGGVLGARARRAFGGQSRALGFGARYSKDEEEGVFSTAAESAHTALATPAHCDEAGGPLSIHEKIIDMLSAGFTPRDNPQLLELCKSMLTNVIESATREYHVVMPRSLEAFVVADWTGSLAPGEIFFQSNKLPPDPETGAERVVLLGDLLMYRNPLRVPSDVRKVKAVSRAELYRYHGVIVVNVKDHRSLLSILGGGDYDGDTCALVWEPELVAHFRQPEIFDPPPGFKEKNFEVPSGRAQDNFNDIQHTPSISARQDKWVNLLMLSMTDSIVGIYSKFHENAAWELGYGHETTIRLGHMFTHCLDSVKTGLIVKPEVFKADKKRWNYQKPEFMRNNEEAKYEDTTNFVVTRRTTDPYVLKELFDHGETIKNTALQRFETNKYGRSSNVKDADLLAPYTLWSTNARNWPWQDTAGELRRELKLLKDHVELAANMFRSATAASKSPQKSPVKKSKTARNEEFQAVLRFYLETPANLQILSTIPGAIERIKASYAVHCSGPSSSFPYSVAFGMICAIKAEANNPAIVARQFYDIMSIQQSIARGLKRRRDEGVGDDV